MKNITFKEYVSLADNDKREYDFYIKYGDFEQKDYLSDIPIEERPFILVKELMMSVDEPNKLSELLETIDEYKYTNIANKPFYEAVISFKYIVEHIVRLIEIEAELLTSKVFSPVDYSDKIQQVDFSVFPQFYSQLRALAGNDITKYEAIKNMKYSDCFVELLYMQKEADLQKLIDNANRQKNRGR